MFHGNSLCCKKDNECVFKSRTNKINHFFRRLAFYWPGSIIFHFNLKHHKRAVDTCITPETMKKFEGVQAADMYCTLCNLVSLQFLRAEHSLFS